MWVIESGESPQGDVSAVFVLRVVQKMNSPRAKAGEMTGGRGQDRKCHKLSQIVMTFYDEFYDDL